MINNPSIEKTKQILKNETGVKIIVAQSDEYNRKMMEYGKFDVLLGIENPERKLTLRNLDSGLNPFLASLLAKNKVSLGWDFSYIEKLEGKEKALVLAQMMQNLKICRKKKAKIVLVNCENREKGKELMKSLGSSSLQVKEALAF